MEHNCFEMETISNVNERHFRNFTFMKYQQTNGWLSLYLANLQNSPKHINVSFSPRISINFKNIKF